MDINSEAYAGEDNIYPLARGEIEDTPQPSSAMHCMMASHSDVSCNKANEDRLNRTASGQIITQVQIHQARRVYTSEEPLGPNPTEDKLATLHFIVNEQKAQIASEKRVLERRRGEADASSHRRANL
jgi:hypothetical protein